MRWASANVQENFGCLRKPNNADDYIKIKIN